MVAKMEGGGFVVTGASDVERARLAILKSALSLEMAGMKRRGRSALSLVKDLGFKGSKQAVYTAFCKAMDFSQGKWPKMPDEIPTE